MMSNSISLHGFDFITYEDGDRNNEIVIKQIQDFHAWVVDCPQWTEDVVYKLWDVEHVSVAYPAIMKMQKCSSPYLTAIEPLSHEQKLI